MAEKMALIEDCH